MKKILSICFLLAVVASTYSQPILINRNASETFTKKVTTPGATATRIDLVPVASNEAGHIVIKVIGYSPDSAAIVTGTRTYRYTKVAGTLTLGSAIETVPIIADTKVSGATFAASALSDNIEIKVTGKASVVMYWTAIVKQTAARKDE